MTLRVKAGCPGSGEDAADGFEDRVYETNQEDPNFCLALNGVFGSSVRIVPENYNEDCFLKRFVYERKRKYAQGGVF